ncbi:Transcriptional Regulator, MarR family [Stanieria sp. NIES-3757]|nr:Transcriptional Regulator, MarR family [Stanieria sp. NIES-3757]
MKSKLATPKPIANAAEKNKSIDTATELMETIPAIMQFIRTEMRSQREPSLSVPQFRVLVFLARHSDSSLSEVAEHLGITRATASTMIDRLVQRGLVARQEDPQQRRQIMLRLTPIGSDRLEEMRAITRNQIANLLEELSLEELTNISVGLTILRKVFTDF